VVVVSGGRLAGVAKPAPVVGDHPVAGLQQHRDLPVPGTAAERVAVNQDDRPSLAVVLVVEVDRGRVLPADADVCHGFLRFSVPTTCWSRPLVRRWTGAARRTAPTAAR